MDVFTIIRGLALVDRRMVLRIRHCTDGVEDVIGTVRFVAYNQNTNLVSYTHLAYPTNTDPFQTSIEGQGAFHITSIVDRRMGFDGREILVLEWHHTT